MPGGPFRSTQSRMQRGKDLRGFPSSYTEPVYVSLNRTCCEILSITTPWKKMHWRTYSRFPRALVVWYWSHPPKHHLEVWLGSRVQRGPSAGKQSISCLRYAPLCASAAFALIALLASHQLIVCVLVNIGGHYTQL